MKKILLSFALIVGLLTSASTLQAQVNMSRYITLTVTNGAAIKLDFKAAAAGTPVRIVSGSNTQDITVGTGWYNGNYISTFTVTAAASTMTIYGDIIAFKCSDNYSDLTALDPSHNTQLMGLYCSDNTLSSLDVSHNTQLTTLNCSSNTLSSLDVSKNTQLTRLYCHGNNFSTAALDDIFCALPVRQASDDVRIQPVYDSSSSNYATVIATNKTNATAKNWKVQYYYDDTDIPATTGSYVCSGGGTTTYAIYIAGVKVTSANCSDLSVIDSVSGTVKYDPTNKVLTLENATIQINTTNAIVSNIDGLTIKVIGTNNLTTGSSPTLSFIKPLTITGGGVLNAKSEGDCAIYSSGTNLTIDGCTVNAKGRYGIAGFDGSSEMLTIKNSTVTAEGTDGSIIAFASLILDGCAITQPAGAAFDASLHAVALGGSVVTSKVVISPTGGEPNMSSYITLTVTNGAAIKLDFKAAAEGTPVRIVSGSNTQDIIVGTGWTGTASYTAGSTTMTVYGDITDFDCSENGVNLTALDPSHNTQLTELYCGGNTLSSLDVSKNTQLTGVWCGDNNLSNLDVSHNTQLTGLGCSNNRLSNLDISHNTQLTELFCRDNKLSSLDVSHNTQLTELYCESNNLSSLDVSKNTQLTRLGCSNNRLSNLDISHNTQLTTLYCHGNNFTTAALDDIFCALPDRTGKENGLIEPVYSDTSSNHAIVLATNKANAIAKNWKVQYYADDTDIPATTGSYVCPATDIAEAATEPALTLYPNPVADVLYLSATARTVRIYNMYGTEVAHATDTDKVEVSHLPAGVYTVKADGTVAKMVKR